ncbi:putative uncharacterized protein C7orf78 [Styela clava]
MIPVSIRPQTTQEHIKTLSHSLPDYESQQAPRNCNSASSYQSNRSTYIERQTSFEFLDKARFIARENTSSWRSRKFKPRQQEEEINIWTLKPPNFNPQAFSVKPPERNSREAIRPEKYENESSRKYAKLVVPAAERKKDFKREMELADLVRQASSINLPKTKFERRPNFAVYFHILDPSEAKAQFVKDGMYKPPQYEMPKPHDFRQYPPLKSLGLPQFMTSYDRDPMGINFKSKHLRTIIGPTLQVVTRDVESGSRITHEREETPQWDRELILPKAPFPNKMHAFSRHRRMDRSARSAFLERAEVAMSKRAQEITLLRQASKRKTQSAMLEDHSFPALSDMSSKCATVSAA